MHWLEVEIDEIQAFDRKLFKISRQNTIVSSIFEFYRRLHLEKNFGENFNKAQKVKIVVEELTWFIQIIALLWVPNMKIKNWHKNDLLWTVVDLLRIDSTCSSFGIMDQCLYISILITFINFSGSLALVFAIYCSITISNTIFKVFRKIIYLWITQLFIPTMILLSIFLKYNFSPQKYVKEYEDHNSFIDFEINIGWQVLAVIAMIIAFVLILFFAEFSGEIRHSAARKNLGSRAHSKIETHKAIFTYSLPILYAILAEDHIVYFQLHTMVTSVLFTIETIILSPYYSLYYQVVVIIRFSAVALISFIFLLGYWFDNSLLITLLTVVLVPLYTIIFIAYILKSNKKIDKKIPRSLIGIKSKFSLEKALRYALCSNDFEQKDQIIYIFEKYFLEKTLDRDKLQLVWAANYCLYAIKDESLAKVKLSRTKIISDYSLEANYQEYLCRKKIQNFSPSESTEFLSYFQILKKIKKEDKKLCIGLLKFWKEVTASKPSLRILIKYLNFINHSIEFLNKEYPQLMAKFFNSREPIALYSSYVGGILSDSEKSTLLDSKLRYFDRCAKNSINNSANLSYFNEDNGILIISNDKENFGEICWASQKASEILKTPLNLIIGSNMISFTPYYYKEMLRKELKRNVNFTTNLEKNFNAGFFLTLQTGFLLECIGKSTIASINNFIVSIVVFQPKEPKYETALITESGEILCHSEYFSKFSKFITSNLAGQSLINLFPDLKRLDLKPFTPYNLRNFENETILVLFYFEFNRAKIPYVSLTDDNEEIKKWKDDAFALFKNIAKDEKFEENIQISLNLSISLTTERDSPESNREIQQYCNDSETYLKPINLNKTLEIDKNPKLEEKPGERSPGSQHSSQKTYLGMMITSSRSINILHITYVLSVIFIQILVVIATNIAVLIFAYLSIGFVSNITFPVSVGKIGNYFQLLAFISRMIYYYPSSDPAAMNFMHSGFINITIELEKLYWDVVTNLENWDYCSSKSIFTDNNIFIYNSGSDIYKKTNLVDTISLFIKNGNDFISKYNTSDDFSKELYFIELNGYGNAFEYCNSSLYEIIECQKSKIDDFHIEMTFLLILGIIVLCICAIVMTPFSYSVVKIENIFWNKIRKCASEHYFELTQLSFDRLARAHSEPEFEFNHKSPSKKICNFKNYWKIIWRIFLYFVVVLAFCLINILYLYEQSVNYLSCRPEVIRELMQLRILATGVGVWTSEAALKNAHVSEDWWIKYSLPFKNENIYMHETINKIKRAELALRKSKYSNILSETIKEVLYEKANSNAFDEFVFGVYSAEEISIYDTSFIAYGGGEIKLWLHLMLLVSELNNRYDELITETDHYSQSVINNQIRIIIAVLSIFIAVSFIMYITIYLRFFNEEKNNLRKMHTIMKIMP